MDYNWPLDGCVHVVPSPFSRLVLAMSSLPSSNGLYSFHSCFKSILSWFVIFNQIVFIISFSLWSYLKADHRGTSTEPESGILARGNCLKKTSLQPVVDACFNEKRYVFKKSSRWCHTIQLLRKCFDLDSDYDYASTWMVELCNPGTGVAGTDQVCCRPVQLGDDVYYCENVWRSRKNIVLTLKLMPIIARTSQVQEK